MNAALGVRFLPEDFFRAAFFVLFLRVLLLRLADFRAVLFRAGFLAVFFRAAVFFLVAIACLPVNVGPACLGTCRNYRDKQYNTAADLQ
jgi:hypothetical protein